MIVAHSSPSVARRRWRLSARAAAFASVCLPALVACSSAENNDGSLRGELHIYSIDYPDGHIEHDYYLAPDDHSPATTHLHFAQDPGLDPWAKLKVWGDTAKDGTVNVTRYQEVIDEVGVVTQPLTNVTPKTQTVGFVMMDIGNGVNIDAATAQTAVFGTRAATSAGLNQYYTENSYGGLSFTGQIFGPVMNNSIGTCQTSAVTAIEKLWPTQFGVDMQHWMTYIGSNDTDCGWSGLGGEGSAARPASGSWYNASTGCTVLAQEVGHNLGLMHSNSLRCPNGDIFEDAPQGTCTAAEYGDRHTVMGQGCAHFNGYEKWYEGFFGGCNGVHATKSGTYTLLPTELACNGAQVLQIPMPKTRPFANTTGTTTVVQLTKYYLELRTKVSIDGRETQAVLVEVGADVPAANKTSQFTWVLDMVPSSTNTYDGMTLGQTYNDPAGGLSFTVAELDANHASIQVTLATETDPTCIDGTTFAMPGPATCDGGVVGSGGAGGAGGAGGSAGTGAGGSSGTGAGGTGTSGTGAGGSSGNGAGGTGTSGTGTSGTGGNGAGGLGVAGSGTAGTGTGTAGNTGTAGTTGTAGNTGAAGTGTGSAGDSGTAGAGTAGTSSGSAGSSTGTAGASGSGAGAAGGAPSGSAGMASGVAGASSPTAGSGTVAAPPPSATAPNSPGCSCRTAGSSSTAPNGLLGLAVLALGVTVARKRRRASPALRSPRLALGVSFVAGLVGCSSKSDGAPNSNSTGVINQNPACADAGSVLSPGFTVTSADGYTFDLTSLDPARPVISTAPPGNTWQLQINDAMGAPASGSLLVSSYMPEHMHSGPPAVGIDLGNGSYEVDELLLPMPALYDITLTLTPAAGATAESATLSVCVAASSG